MNRELKYKAWDGENMYLSPSSKEGMHHLASWFEAHSKYGSKGKESIILEWTGLTDKTGKEIYEGDIFKLGAEKEIFEVRFEHGCFMAFCNGKQYGLIGELRICFIEVIGSIHSNPELLR